MGGKQMFQATSKIATIVRRGIGRDGGDCSFDFYMETKNISVAYDSHVVPKIGA
jgi:5-carboxymethyl-2-hydroxymuconic-semialdehyde dehydrogenase